MATSLITAAPSSFGSRVSSAGNLERQALHAVEERRRLPLRRPSELPVREPREQTLDDDGGVDAGKERARAGVFAVAEAEVVVVEPPRDVEFVDALIDVLVTIRAREHPHHVVALLDHLIRDLHALCRGSTLRPPIRETAQGLLDRVRNQLRPLDKEPSLIRMLDHRLREEREHVASGLAGAD